MTPKTAATSPAAPIQVAFSHAPSDILSTTMQGESSRQSVCVNNPQGFHMRPMAAFVAAANRFAGTVTVSREGEPPANGKSILSLMGLVAVPGTVLVIEVCGPDAAKALSELVSVFERSFDE